MFGMGIFCVSRELANLQFFKDDLSYTEIYQAIKFYTKRDMDNYESTFPNTHSQTSHMISEIMSEVAK